MCMTNSSIEVVDKRINENVYINFNFTLGIKNKIL